ncbi:glucan 1,3-beta-glucosidase [Colletotrichum tofieldiae]|nr:glucan 1,3-beta-glucosidase [Colletotrichum tofieldiae]
MRVTTAFWLAVAALAKAAYWMEDVEHQGISAYHPDPNYKVFRNVKEFGAKGDGVTDDTAAINLAISSGQRCGPGTCKGETTSPATVYFPPGTYLITGSIIDFFYTQIIGDPTDRPVIKAAANFPTNTTLGLLDGNQYGANGLSWGATNVFFRQVRNLVFDTTAIPASAAALAIHWPSSQATAITNCAFHLAEGADSKHVGIFIEEGSGGLMNDLDFYGGQYGANFGNQQYTLRGARFFNAQVAINQLWDWGWTYKSIYIENCGTGIRMQDNSTSSITLIDSEFVNVQTAIRTSRDPGVSVPPTAGTLVLENVALSGVNTILLGPQNNTIIPGSSGSVLNQGFAMGHIYTPTGPTDYTGADASYFPVYPALLGASSTNGTKYYERSKPHYEDDIRKPHPVVKVAIPGQCGTIEWSDMIVSTRGAAPGAKVIEYNLNTVGEPSGMWDVHIRVGGFAGTQQQLEQCPTTPNATITADTLDENCIAAWMSMHITRPSSNLLMENCWLWVADHDLEDPNYKQVTIYAGRGLLIESANGKIWLSASGSEHHTLYQYQLFKTRDVYMGQIQSETPYYQPNPVATIPFPRVLGYHDPDFEADCKDHDPSAPPCEMAWGLRVIGSRNVVAFGAGHYSFFNNYSTACCQIGAGARCQQRIVDIRDGPGNCTATDNVELYNLQIVGTTAMVTRDGTDVAFFRDNIAGFTAGIALYQH